MAHVRWFIDSDAPALSRFVPYSLSDGAVQLWIAVGVLFVASSVAIDLFLPRPRLAPGGVRQNVVGILRMFVGISFLITAYEGNLIAPHLPGYGWFGVALATMQAVIGMMFIANRYLFHAAMMIFILVLGVFIQHGTGSVFEYCNIIGIALFFLLRVLPDGEGIAKYKPYSIDILRIFTGVALITLGITEKLSGAALGEAFIAQYQWNFMPLLGFESFSDRLFVLSAGVMEVVFGAILLLGTTTRLNTLVISFFMLASNITFLVSGNNEAALMELIGHMPIIGTALVLLAHGSGAGLKITNVLQFRLESHARA